MFDWYHAMAATQVELIAWFQHQLRRRGFYDGPIDGVFNPATDESIIGYRKALGLSARALLDETFFYAFLAADHTKVERPPQPARYVAPPVTAAVPPAPTAEPLSLTIDAPNRTARFARGEAINLALTPSQDAHVYCYLRDENARVARFFPNRFERDSRVAASRPLRLPGAQRFQLVMNPLGVTETVACFATPRDVLAELPQSLVGIDFEPLAGATLESIRAAFAQASGGQVAQENFEVQAK
jgi:hypothetical protein